MKRFGVLSVGLLIILFGTRHTAQTPRAPAKFRRASGQVVPNSYIVVLQDKAQRAEAVEALAVELSRNHRAERGRVFTHALRGFTVSVSESDARRLSEDPRVAYVQEDGVAYGESTQAGPTNWGLDRIDQRSLPLNSSFNYYADGTGVNIYIVDSGVRVTHSAFGGRASGAYSAVPDGIPASEDCHGHGTHVAGIAASSQWGVAKNANILSVKALGCDNSGPWSGYVAALDWIVANGVRPAVINASIGGSLDTAAAEAIDAAVAAGFTFVGSAGNWHDDACAYTPGGASSAIIVGSAAYNDQRAFSSNWGTCVDIFAPGDNIESASAVGDSSYVTMSGTSMASPHVAGAAALYLQRFPNATPAQVRAEILRGATRGVLTDINTGSPNLLLFTPYLGDTISPTVTLTSPPSGATLSGAITVSATASDNAELQGVRFFVGSAEIAFDTLAPYTTSWNSNVVSDGTLTIRARAIDLAGHTSDRTMTVTIRNGVDTTPPVVTITEPLSGLPVGGVVTIQASASDNIGVARVDFLVDGVAINTDATAPFSLAWNSTGVPDGVHTLVAKAFDGAGNNKLSSPVVVEVNNVTSAVLPSGWSNADIGLTGSSGSAAYDNGTFTLRAGGVDVWSSADALHYVYRPWTGDGDIVARVAGLPLPAGAAFAMSGVMFRESLTANARHAAVLIGTNGKLKFRRRTAVGGATSSDGPSEGSVSVPYWLKLSRRGDSFSAYQSVDGATWVQTGPTTTLSLPTTLYVGVWALRNGGTAPVQASITNVAVNTVIGGLPAGWNSRDVGATGSGGTTGYASGTFMLQASGTDLWSTADAFHFAYRSWTGDGDIIARIGQLPLPSGAEFAMAGVMFRESLEANARHAAVLVGTNGKLKFRRRTSVGGSTLSDGPSEGSVTAPYWLKLSRRGQVFTAFRSQNGTTWTPVGPTTSLALPATVHVGIWALRSGATLPVQATITDLTLAAPGLTTFSW